MLQTCSVSWFLSHVHPLLNHIWFQRIKMATGLQSGLHKPMLYVTLDTSFIYSLWLTDITDFLVKVYILHIPKLNSTLYQSSLVVFLQHHAVLSSPNCADSYLFSGVFWSFFHRSLILPVLSIISVWMLPEWHSGCLWIGLKRGGGLIFTAALENIGLQSLGEKMVLITDLFYSLSLSVSASLSFFPSHSTILLSVFSSTPLINKLEWSPFKFLHGIFKYRAKEKLLKGVEPYISAWKTE